MKDRKRSDPSARQHHRSAMEDTDPWPDKPPECVCGERLPSEVMHSHTSKSTTTCRRCGVRWRADRTAHQWLLEERQLVNVDEVRARAEGQRPVKMTVNVLRVTRKALLVERGEASGWIPRSVLLPGSEQDLGVMRQGVIVIPRWLATERGLV